MFNESMFVFDWNSTDSTVQIQTNSLKYSDEYFYLDL